MPRLRSYLPLIVPMLVLILCTSPAVVFASAPVASLGGMLGGEQLMTFSVAGVFSLASGVLTHFVTRREWSSKVGDLERRISVIETQGREDIKALHEKINRVDRSVAVVETEVRSQSDTLRAIAVRLKVTAL